MGGGIIFKITKYLGTTQTRSETVFCLLIITLFTSFFFVNSVAVREPWIQPTFMTKNIHHEQWTAASALMHANNWLKEGIFNLRFGLYDYPASVEMPTLDKRTFSASYPPGSRLPIYLLLKVLDLTVIPDIYEKRGMQLLVLTMYNYFMHFLLVLTLCWMAFFICLRLGFDHLNSTLLAIVPAIIQFHNASSLYYNHIFYDTGSAVFLPFALYVFLELARIVHCSSRIVFAARILQPLLIFYGVLSDQLFVFVALTIYAMRLARKEIDRPVSLQQGLLWAKQSFLFFAPAIAAITIWVFQITYYLNNITNSKISTTVIDEHDHTLPTKLLELMGITDGIDYYIFYFKNVFFSHLIYGYGIVALVMLYAAFYMTTRGRKFITEKKSNYALVTNTYLMFFIPCIAHSLLFLQYSFQHRFSSNSFGLPISLCFVFVPILIMWIMRKNHLMSLVNITNKKSISLVALLGISSSVGYGYFQVYNNQNLTKMFSTPTMIYPAIGSFIKKNTKYTDVVFSSDYTASNSTPTGLFFTNKPIHSAHSLDQVYHKTKLVEQDFTIKVLYLELHKEESEKLKNFLETNNIRISSISEEGIGGLLAFDGKTFLTWYNKVHECDLHPQRCELEER